MSKKTPGGPPPGHVPLAEVPAVLREITGRPPPRYNWIYSQVLNTEIPSVRVGGRYYIALRDLRTLVTMADARAEQRAAQAA